MPCTPTDRLRGAAPRGAVSCTPLVRRLATSPLAPDLTADGPDRHRHPTSHHAHDPHCQLQRRCGSDTEARLALPCRNAYAAAPHDAASTATESRGLVQHVVSAGAPAALR